MQIQLADKDKCSMLFLGNGINFTYDEPGPVEVDVSTLTPDQRNQLYYHWKRGVLAVSDEDGLKSACNLPPPAPKSYAPTVQVIPNDAHPVTQPMDVTDAIESRKVRLRALLREKIPVIKRSLAGLAPTDLVTLIRLEEETKNRKKLLKELQDFMQRRFSEVSRSVGTEDVGKSTFNPAAQNLDNSLDVVESEMEDVTLIPSDKELAKENG